MLTMSKYFNNKINLEGNCNIHERIFCVISLIKPIKSGIVKNPHIIGK